MEYVDKNNSDFRPWGMAENTFCMLLHLSQLAGYIIPLAGTILPIIMWATNKDQSEAVNKHGKVVFNWMISSFIYVLVGSILIIVIIGIPILIALGICSLIFIILGAVKANEGIVYNYPLAIPFFK